MEALSGLPVIQGSALAVITVYAAWSLYATLTGRLIPRSWVDAMRTQDKVIEADLRSRLEDANETLRTERQQKELVMNEFGDTLTKTLRSLPEPGAGDQEGRS